MGWMSGGEKWKDKRQRLRKSGKHYNYYMIKTKKKEKWKESNVKMK